MSEKRPGFFLQHEDLADLRDDYSEEEIGRLILALYAVSIGEEPARFDERGLRGKFKEMSRKIQKSSEKYQHVCEVNKSNICKRWNTTEYDRIPPNDPEYGRIRLNTNINTNINTNKKRELNINKPPTLEAVREYARSKGYGFSCDIFFSYYEARGWNGVSDWKSLADVWEKRGLQNSQAQHYDLERAGI